MTVHVLCSRERLDQLWEAYRRLVQERQDYPALALDRDHVQRTILAHERFRRAYVFACETVVPIK